MIRCLLILAVASLAGCGASDPPAPVPAPAAAPDTTAQATPLPSLVIDGEGLRVVAASGSTQPLAFGTHFDTAVDAVSEVRGEPAQRDVSPECGAGALDYAEWADGLTVYGQDGEFRGWALGSRGAPGDRSSMTTMTGLGLGSTRAEMESAYDAVVEESTLGTEFAAGDLYGLLSGPDPDATVESLWAGVSCNFR